MGVSILIPGSTDWFHVFTVAVGLVRAGAASQGHKKKPLKN